LMINKWKPSAKLESSNASAATPFGTPSTPICSKPVTTSGLFRSYLATKTSAPLKKQNLQWLTTYYYFPVIQITNPCVILTTVLYRLK
jgi:hypothetical protein